MGGVPPIVRSSQSTLHKKKGKGFTSSLLQIVFFQLPSCSLVPQLASDLEGKLLDALAKVLPGMFTQQLLFGLSTYSENHHIVGERVATVPCKSVGIIHDCDSICSSTDQP